MALGLKGKYQFTLYSNSSKVELLHQNNTNKLSRGEGSRAELFYLSTYYIN